MSRGPSPRRALADAIPLAEKRGTVQHIPDGPEKLCDFVIWSAVPVAFVRVKRAERILASLPAIAQEFHEPITGLRLVASSVTISRELWPRSRHGTWRFFRVTGDGIIELGRDGEPLRDSGPAGPAAQGR
jgi:hypothetical protein